jgi:hypothetical protein
LLLSSKEKCGELIHCCRLYLPKTRHTYEPVCLIAFTWNVIILKLSKAWQ